MKKLVLVAAMAGLMGCTSAQAVDNTVQWENGEVAASSHYGMKAKLLLSNLNNVAVYFDVDDGNCLGRTEPRPAAVIQLNKQWLKMTEQCNKKGVRTYWAATQEGRKFVLDEFTKTKGNVEILSNGHTILYSAKKFSLEYTKLVRRKVHKDLAI